MRLRQSQDCFPEWERAEVMTETAIRSEVTAVEIPPRMSMALSIMPVQHEVCH